MYFSSTSLHHLVHVHHRRDGRANRQNNEMKLTVRTIAAERRALLPDCAAPPDPDHPMRTIRFSRSPLILRFAEYRTTYFRLSRFKKCFQAALFAENGRINAKRRDAPQLGGACYDC
jgi:hypothetical protein